MTTAIGVVITEHIVAGRLQDQRLSGTTILFPDQSDGAEDLASMPGSKMVELLATQIETLVQREPVPVDAIGIAVPGIIRHGVDHLSEHASFFARTSSSDASSRR